MNWRTAAAGVFAGRCVRLPDNNRSIRPRPRVAGQHYDYVVKQLKDFKARSRTNDAGNMTSVAGTLSDQDIDNLGHYIANLN